MMNFKDFLDLIAQCLGYKDIGTTVSEKRYRRLKPFLERELSITLPNNNPPRQTYNDLWKVVMDALDDSKSYLSPMENHESANTNSVTLPQKSGATVIPVSLQVTNRLKQISTKIDKDNEALEECLDEIENLDSSIHIDSILGIVKRNSVETAISNVYSSLTRYISRCGDAIRASNVNTSNVLKLIKLLTEAEVDLYHLMDDQTIQSNELRILIKEWCQKHGIHDKEVDKLLESSFQRAYTLRDRINDLRKDFYEKIDKNNEQIRELRSHYSDYQAKIQEATDSALLSLKASAEERKYDIDNHFFERQKELQKRFDLLSSSANKEIERIETIKHSLDEDEVELEKKVASYYAVIAEKERSIQQQSDEIKEQFSIVAKELSDKGLALEEMSRTAITEFENKHQTALEELQKNSQTFRSDIEERLGKKDEATEKELKLMREGQEWFKKDIKKTLDEKYQELADLHKQFIIDQTTIISKLEHQVKTYKIVAVIAGVVSVASIVIGLLV